MISTSLDWTEKRASLVLSLNALPYNPDLRKLLNNIDGMVQNLSKAEVSARRLNKPVNSLRELTQVNDAIRVVEQWIMFAGLSF